MITRLSLHKVYTQKYFIYFVNIMVFPTFDISEDFLSHFSEMLKIIVTNRFHNHSIHFSLPIYLYMDRYDISRQKSRCNLHAVFFQALMSSWQVIYRQIRREMDLKAIRECCCVCPPEESRVRGRGQTGLVG